MKCGALGTRVTSCPVSPLSAEMCDVPKNETKLINALSPSKSNASLSNNNIAQMCCFFRSSLTLAHTLLLSTTTFNY